MEHSRISSKGQLVIPKGLREKLDWREGDEIIFSLEDNKLTLQALAKRDLSEILSQKKPSPAHVEYTGFEQLLELERQSAKIRRAQGR
jgi:AbrB family looped-hinge helix DNA binding protein